MKNDQDTPSNWADPHRVMPFQEWCRRVSISEVTGHRLKSAGKAPRITRISDRRIGVAESDHLMWLQQARSSPDGNVGNALRIVEQRLIALGELVATGGADRRKVIERLRRAATEAGLAEQTTA